jgi:hypothetical protein
VPPADAVLRAQNSIVETGAMTRDSGGRPEGEKAKPLSAEHGRAAREDGHRPNPPAHQPDTELIEKVSLAIVQAIGWGTFSHFDPGDVRRIARAAIEAMALTERERIVEWLRNEAAMHRKAMCDDKGGHLIEFLAHSISQGEHLHTGLRGK